MEFDPNLKLSDDSLSKLKAGLGKISKDVLMLILEETLHKDIRAEAYLELLRRQEKDIEKIKNL